MNAEEARQKVCAYYNVDMIKDRILYKIEQAVDKGLTRIDFKDIASKRFRATFVLMNILADRIRASGFQVNIGMCFFGSYCLEISWS